MKSCHIADLINTLCLGRYEKINLQQNTAFNHLNFTHISLLPHIQKKLSIILYINKLFAIKTIYFI